MPQQPAANQDHRCNRQHRLGDGIPHRFAGRRRFGRAEQRNGRQQRNGDDVLKQQDGECQSAIAGGEILALGEQLQAHRSGGQGQPQGNNHPGFPTQGQPPQQAAKQYGTAQHLQAADAEHLPPHHPKPRR